MTTITTPGSDRHLDAIDTAAQAGPLHRLRTHAATTNQPMTLTYNGATVGRIAPAGPAWRLDLLGRTRGTYPTRDKALTGAGWYLAAHTDNEISSWLKTGVTP